MSLLIKFIKCEHCDKWLTVKFMITKHYKEHKELVNKGLLNKDIVNYAKFNRSVKYLCETALIQTWDISNVITMKELVHHISIEIWNRRNVFYFKNAPCCKIDFENYISKCIRNEFGISNCNGKIIGLSFKIYEHDDPNLC